MGEESHGLEQRLRNEDTLEAGHEPPPQALTGLGGFLVCDPRATVLPPLSCSLLTRRPGPGIGPRFGAFRPYLNSRDPTLFGFFQDLVSAQQETHPAASEHRTRVRLWAPRRMVGVGV